MLLNLVEILKKAEETKTEEPAKEDISELQKLSEELKASDN